jgi:hypothetical protein
MSCEDTQAKGPAISINRSMKSKNRSAKPVPRGGIEIDNSKEGASNL